MPRGCPSRRVIPSPRVSIDHPRILVSCRHGGGTHARGEYNGDNYVFRGHRRGGTPVGRASGAWRRVPRQFATRSSSDHLSSGWHCTRDDPGSRAALGKDDSIVRRSGPTSERPDIRIERSAMALTRRCSLNGS